MFLEYFLILHIFFKKNDINLKGIKSFDKEYNLIKLYSYFNVLFN